MPEYRIRETGEIVINLAAAFPNVSFPVSLTEDDYDMLGIDPVFEAPQPEHTRFQSPYRDGVEEIDGKWFAKWGVSDWSEEAIAAATERQWESVRQQRNAKLSQCDWTQLPDCPLSNTKQLEWAAYRQALRDITSQVDPFSIAWPELP